MSIPTPLVSSSEHLGLADVCRCVPKGCHVFVRAASQIRHRIVAVAVSDPIHLLCPIGCIKRVCYALECVETPYGGLGMAKPTSRVELLGSFRVSCDRDHQALNWSAQRVLALSALKRRPMTRERVAGTLWPDVDQQRAHGRLRTALWRLGPARRLLEVENGHLSLDETCEVDLYEAERVGEALAAGAPLPEQSRVLLEMFSQDLLPDWDEPWILTDRERYREIRVHALEALAAASLSRGDHLQGIRACLYAIRCSPFRDSSHRLLVEAYIAEGNQSAALQHILGYRKALRQKLGLTSDNVLSDLVEELAG